MHRKASSSLKWQRSGDSLGRTPRPQTMGTGSAKKSAIRRHAALAAGKVVGKEPVTPIRFELSKKHSHHRHSQSSIESKTAISKPVRAFENVEIPAATSEANHLPANTCTRNYIPCQATFALSKFNNLLQFITPGSLVAFDIDDTLVKKRHYGASLLTNEGANKFSEYVQQNYKHRTFAERQQMVNRFYAELKEFSLAESDTAQVVRALQDRGAYVFGLTARASSLAYATSSSLTSLGIDLSATTPPSLPSRALESATGAVVVDGIVYCNDTDKGVVLQRLLQLGWVSWPNRKPAQLAKLQNTQSRMTTTSVPNETVEVTQTSSSSTLPPELHESSEDGRICPDRTIWFVDDSLQMILGMMQSWAAMTQSHKDFYASLGEFLGQVPCRGKLSLVCCHYTHPEAAASALTTQLDSELKEQIIQLQIEEYVSSGTILNDSEALNRLEASPRVLSKLGFAAMAADREEVTAAPAALDVM